jgi:hypothetical protein
MRSKTPQGPTSRALGFPTVAFASSFDCAPLSYSLFGVSPLGFGSSMAFSTEELQALKDKIDLALRGDALNAWERTFLNDIRARLGMYGTGTRLSNKQRNKIDEIVGGQEMVREAKRSNRNGRQSRRRQRKQTRFGSPRQPRRRRYRRKFAGRYRWLIRRIVWRVVLPVAILAGFVLFTGVQQGQLGIPDSTNVTKQVSNLRYSVTDGDTIRVRWESKGTRLVGFNTPETYKPQCKRELELGKKATERLKELFATSKMELEKVPWTSSDVPNLSN